jgi:hypothetical protein
MALLAALATLVALSAASPATAADEASLRLDAKAEACIRENAASVERSEQSLSGAASFLLDYICVNQISISERYRANKLLLYSMQHRGDETSGWTLLSPGVGMTDAQKAIQADIDIQRAAYKDASVDPDTGEIVFANSAKSSKGFYSAVLIADQNEGVVDSVRFRAFAGQAILEARQSRLAH